MQLTPLKKKKKVKSSRSLRLTNSSPIKSEIMVLHWFSLYELAHFSFHNFKFSFRNFHLIKVRNTFLHLFLSPTPCSNCHSLPSPCTMWSAKVMNVFSHSLHSIDQINAVYQSYLHVLLLPTQTIQCTLEDTHSGTFWQCPTKLNTWNNVR